MEPMSLQVRGLSESSCAAHAHPWSDLGQMLRLQLFQALLSEHEAHLHVMYMHTKNNSTQN